MLLWLGAMRILAVDTTTELGGVGLGVDGVLEGAVLLRTPQRYSETLIPMADFLLGQLKASLEQIDLLAVATGPGSFTGVRIGLAVVKAIGQSREISGLGISTLEALAYSFEGHDDTVAPMLDARRDQIFGAVYSWRDTVAEVPVEERVGEPGAWLESIPSHMNPLFVGTGAVVYRDVIRKSRPESRLVAEQPPLLSALIRLAAARAGEAGPVADIRANYIRPSDAQLGRTGA